MKPKKLSEKALELAAHAKSILEEVNRFEAELEKMNLEPLRKSALEEVELAIKNVISEAEEKHIMMLPSKEIIIYSSYRRSGDVISTYLSADNTYKDVNPKGGDLFLLGKNMIGVKFETFKELMKELEASIRGGELNEQIHLTGKHLIYNKIKDAFILPRLIPVGFGYIPEGELVKYVCPHCRVPVPAPYSSVNRILVCASCGSEFESGKTSLGRYQSS